MPDRRVTAGATGLGTTHPGYTVSAATFAMAPAKSPEAPRSSHVLEFIPSGGLPQYGQFSKGTEIHAITHGTKHADNASDVSGCFRHKLIRIGSHPTSTVGPAT